MQVQRRSESQVGRPCLRRAEKRPYQRTTGWMKWRKPITQAFLSFCPRVSRIGVSVVSAVIRASQAETDSMPRPKGRSQAERGDMRRIAAERRYHWIMVGTSSSEEGSF